MSINLTHHGMVRIAVASPALNVADVDFNVKEIKRTATEAQKQGASLCLFPELSLTAYSCADLFFQPRLQSAVRDGIQELIGWSKANSMAIVVGAPLAHLGHLYNCALMLTEGRLAGVVPKTWLPNAGEFYEQRWFSSALQRTTDSIYIAGEEIPFGEDLLFENRDLPEWCMGIELCEDVWTPEPPSGQQALAGATLLLNLSASPELLGKRAYRQQLIQNQSARCLAAYAYASAGPGESSTDLVFAGHSLIAENGQMLAETGRFQFDSQVALADVDLRRLSWERLANTSFSQSKPARSYRRVIFGAGSSGVTGLLRPLSETPFVPHSESERNERCEEIFAIQSTGLMKRLRHTRCKSVVVGLSGGLDSTLALLVAVQAFGALGLSLSGIHCVTMPGFGTTARTRGNAEKLAEGLGCTLRVIPIETAVRQHFVDIGHDEATRDVTYENAQARERTQILMDLANQVNGLVIGTGDLSELALGWCTYNGDHMSMYAVNSGVPKTLVRYLVDWCADHRFQAEVSAILHDVSATPVSPELLPPDDSGNIAQITEEVVGPYLLHDFFLYYLVRQHFEPEKILLFARQAFKNRFDEETLKKWLIVFYRRFFSQQFKRSCLPDGPKVGTIALSPRGDWRMPSDACAAAWLAQLEST